MIEPTPEEPRELTPTYLFDPSCNPDADFWTFMRDGHFVDNSKELQDKLSALGINPEFLSANSSTAIEVGERIHQQIAHLRVVYAAREMMSKRGVSIWTGRLQWFIDDLKRQRRRLNTRKKQRRARCGRR